MVLILVLPYMREVTVVDRNFELTRKRAKR
jgi:hypothetical protein